jgi:hypothetical protein
MGRYIKIFVMVVALPTLVIFGSKGVWAQPFGFGSSQDEESQQKILMSENGRFVFGQISDSSKDQFMLDTFSGRLWRIAESGEIGIFLRTVPYHIEKGEYTPLPGDISESKPKKAEKK